MAVKDANVLNSDARSVIILHGIGTPKRRLETGEDMFWLSQDAFRSTLDLIVGMGDDAPMITFDDGNVSDITIAMPELEDRGLRATFFLLTQRLDTPGSLTSADVRVLSDTGHEIGLHGHGHVDWRHLDDAARHREFITARKRLSDLAGRPVNAAAAPFGLYNRQTLSDLQFLKFEALYTSDRGQSQSDTFIRPRNCLEGSMDRDTLENALYGRVRPFRAMRRSIGITRRRLFPLMIRA